MAEPTLQSVFGTGATQDATTLTIVKADIGITSSTATAESLLAGIIAKAEVTLTSTNQENNPDQSVVIETNSTDNITPRNNINYRVRTKTIDFSKLDEGNIFNPNDY